MRPFPLLVLVVAVFSLYIAYSSISSAFEANSNFGMIAFALHECKHFPTSLDGNLVILRLDDVQAFGYREASIALIDKAFEFEAPVVAGVIPFPSVAARIDADEKTFLYLKKNACNLEIALHGLTHAVNGDSSIPEFGSLAEEQSFEKLLLGKQILEELFSQQVVTFIPPSNIYSAGTRKALGKAGFLAVSSDPNSNPWESVFDYTASTFDWEKGELAETAGILEQCRQGFERNGLCVVMVHPQDYMANGSLDRRKLAQYTEMLSLLKEEGVSFVTFRDIALSQDVPNALP